ncbi:STAS domain-containing protein [Streptomyces sp. NPDC093085]|uniref:STAS domain-containing protein n=1 Tax=Streptomyces sp. NPDC093085 TaxID=3155068 RepID=UPI00342B0C83
MTTTPAHRTDGFSLTAATSDGGTVLRLELHGYLDHDTADRFLADATARLTDAPDARLLRLDCAGLGGLDSMGLSVLLMLHRRTAAAGVRLRLDHRTAALERMLTVTGTLDHLAPGHHSGHGG